MPLLGSERNDVGTYLRYSNNAKCVRSFVRYVGTAVSPLEDVKYQISVSPVVLSHYSRKIGSAGRPAIIALPAGANSQRESSLLAHEYLSTALLRCRHSAYFIVDSVGCRPQFKMLLRARLFSYRVGISFTTSIYGRGETIFHALM